MVRKAVVFDESSSEDEKELVGELQRADQRERARNPHSHEGKAKMPRSRIIQPSSSSGGDVAPAKKRNLFDDSSSSDDDAPTTTSVVRTTRKKVLGEDGDGEDHHEEDEDGVVRINDAYATKFEAIKRKQELHRLTEKYGKRLKSVAGKHGSDEEDEDESGDDAEEDDDAMLLTPEHELAFAKALLAVRKAAVHGTSTADVKEVEEPYLMQRYFPSAEEQTRHNTEVFEKMVEARRHKKTANAAGFTLKDEYERKLTSLATGAEDEKEEAQVGDGSGTRRLRPQTAEERKLREAFLKGVEGDENEEDDGKFIIKPSKKAGTSATTSSTAAAENDDELRDEQVRLLEEAFSLTGGASSSPAAVDGEAPREDQETFIRNFFVKELWRGAEGDDDDDAEGGGGHYNLAQLAQEEADEAFFNDAEVWEREYQDKQFRHEEDGEDVEHVQTFARPIGEAAAGLLRRPDTSRKDARQRRLDRAEEQRQQQLEELKRLKHLKRQEIDEQRALIAAVAGLVGGPRGKHAQAGGDASSSSTSARRGGSDALEKRLQAVWSEHDLDADFNAEEFDRKMASLFNDEFYDDEMVDEDEMAFFEQELDGEGDEDDEAMDIATMRAALAKDPDLFNAASLEEAQQMAAASGTTTSSKKKKGGDVEDGEDPFFSDEFSKLLGGGFDGLGEEAGGRHTSTHTADVLYPDAPAMPGATQADTHKATMDQLQHDLKRKEEEYDRLHYASGSVEGSGLSHFKYREVPAEDFTLSLEEILARDDRQLNMIAPMRCYAAYMDAHSNRRDRGRIERKRTKGFREMDSQRSSRRYGEVERTAVLDSSLSEEKGMEIVANLRKRLREVGEGPTQPFKKPKQQQQQQQHPHLHNRRPQAPSHSHHEPPQRPRFPKKKP